MNGEPPIRLAKRLLRRSDELASASAAAGFSRAAVAPCRSLATLLNAHTEQIDLASARTFELAVAARQAFGETGRVGESLDATAARLGDVHGELEAIVAGEHRAHTELPDLLSELQQLVERGAF